MPDFGSFRGFSEKLTQGQTPTQLGKIGSEATFIGLLDTYPTAARAYSLRLLTTDYGGSAIRVRRSDNTEQDIGFTALGDLNTTTLLSFVGGGDGYVTTWYDQSGNGINATQTTAANQPMIVTSGVLETRTGIGVARPAVRFNNSSLQKMSFTQNLVSKSVFIVLRRRIALTDSLFWLDSGTDYDYHPGSGASPTWLEIFASTSVKNGVNKLNGTVTNLLTTAQTDGLKTISCINEGTSILRGIGGGNTSSRTWDGHQSELIIYNGDKTSTRTGIENDINTYYGIY
jgi:hypothetical protein